MLENFIKWALAAVAVGIIAYIVFGVFAQEVGATWIPQCDEEVVIVDEPVDEPEECTEDCEPVEEPVDEPVVTPEVKKEVRTASSVRYSQGPNGVKGDGYCQLEYHTIKGSKKIEVKYAEDGVFGNGFKSFTTEDDGAIDLKLEGNSASVKIRGRDSKTEWSDTKLVNC